jgi:hypothetical protein
MFSHFGATAGRQRPPELAATNWCYSPRKFDEPTELRQGNHDKNHQGSNNSDYRRGGNNMFRGSAQQRAILRRRTLVCSRVRRYRQRRMVLLLSLGGGMRAQRGGWKSRVLQFEPILDGFARDQWRKALSDEASSLSRCNQGTTAKNKKTAKIAKCITPWSTFVRPVPSVIMLMKSVSASRT